MDGKATAGTPGPGQGRIPLPNFIFSSSRIMYVSLTADLNQSTEMVRKKRPLQIAAALSFLIDRFSMAALCVYYIEITRPRS